MAVFWAFIIAFIVVLARGVRGDYHHRRYRHMDEPEENGIRPALAILNERYAKGEINKEEYDQKKKDLSGR